jgi:hypothetical protein
VIMRTGGRRSPGSLSAMKISTGFLDTAWEDQYPLAPGEPICGSMEEVFEGDDMGRVAEEDVFVLR